jgi:hypothetical protein
MSGLAALGGEALAEPGGISAELGKGIEQTGSSDLVVGLPTSDAERTGQAIESLRAALSSGPFSSVTVVVPADAIPGGGPSRAGLLSSNGSFRLLPSPFSVAGRPAALADGLSEACRAVFAIGKKLQPRACAVVGSDLETFSPEWIQRLIQPVSEQNFDLVLPSYTRHKFDALLTCSILYPLIRALYGKRIQWPIALDFALSARMMDRLLVPDPPSVVASRRGPPIWMITEAIVADFRICQSHLGVRVAGPRDSIDLGTVISHLLGPVFIDMEYHARDWQRIRNSQVVAAFGGAAHRSEDGPESVDVRPMVEAFQLGFQNLQQVWALVLPPATLFELKKLTRLSVDHFRLADGLWARIVYDFALGHRLRALNRDHLLRAMTPLYRAWIASYALEGRSLSVAEVERRLEKLCLAYESEKTYLVSRWRWPDRFSP